MSFALGQTISASDLNGLWTTSLAALKLDNQEKPGVYWHQFQFININSTTEVHRRTGTLILPDDCYIEDVCVTSGEMVGTLTVAITSETLLEDITLTGTVAAGFSQVARYNGPYHVLLRGSEVTITASTTDASGSQVVHVGVGLQTYRRRY